MESYAVRNTQGVAMIYFSMKTGIQAFPQWFSCPAPDYGHRVGMSVARRKRGPGIPHKVKESSTMRSLSRFARKGNTSPISRYWFNLSETAFSVTI